MSGEAIGLAAGESQAEPDAEGSEDGGDEAAVDFKRMLDDEEAVFGELQDGDQETSGDAIKQDVAERTAAGRRGGVGTSEHGEK